MSAPHISGVMALLKQSHPQLSVKELKSLLMGTAKSIQDAGKAVYPVSRMGAGRVQVDPAVHASVIGTTGVSLGVMSLESQKTVRRSVSLHNITSGDLKLKASFVGSAQMKIADQIIELKSFATKDVSLEIKLSAEGLKEGLNELSGILQFKDGDKEVFRIPILTIATQISQIKATSLVVQSTSSLGSAGSAADLTLRNNSRQAGTALLFNLIGNDERKSDPSQNLLKSRACDLQAAGYRIVDGKLQVAIKLYDAVTTWHLCETSVLIDSDGDSQPDQEIVGVPAERLEGLQGKDFNTLLLDANVAREIRKKYESDLQAAVAAGVKRPSPPNYAPAVRGLDAMKVYNSSSVAIVQMDLAALKLKPTGEFSIKVATSAQEDMNVESDDFLGNDKWLSLDRNVKAQSYVNFPESITVPALSDAHIALEKGEGSSPLMILYPQNRSVIGVREGDEQLEFVEAIFKP